MDVATLACAPGHPIAHVDTSGDIEDDGAVEVRRNAARGFRSVTLPERPQRIGLPSLSSSYWDPVVAACHETDTVISLHVSTSGMPELPPDGPLLALGGTLFGQMSLTACAEWLWSGLPVRFPDVRIAMGEGGIGWVAMLLDRLDNIVDPRDTGYGHGYDSSGLNPADVLQRNFWFCKIDDPSTIDTRHRIGLDHIMVEVDYPLGDSTWPDTQAVLARSFGHLPEAELRAVAAGNASRLFRHQPPPRDDGQRAAVADLTRRVWRESGRPRSEGRLAPGLFDDVDTGPETDLAGAPVLVVVGGDSSVAHRSTLASSIFPATQNLLLAANALGLGSAMTTLATLEASTLGAILGLPDDVHPMAVVPLGWPARPLGLPRRFPVEQRAHRYRFGTPWPSEPPTR